MAQSLHPGRVLAIRNHGAAILRPSSGVVCRICQFFFTVADFFYLARPDAVCEKDGADGFCAAFSQSEVVLSSTSLVTVTCNHDATIRISTKNLCMSTQGREIRGTDNRLIKVKVKSEGRQKRRMKAWRVTR